MYFVYVLRSQKDSKFYYGMTNNLVKRLMSHNNMTVKSTKSRAPFDLIYYENADNIQEVRNKENILKVVLAENI